MNRKVERMSAHPLTLYPLLPAHLHHQVDCDRTYPVHVTFTKDVEGNDILSRLEVVVVEEEVKTPIIGSVVEVMTGKYLGMKGFVSFRSLINGYSGGVVEQFIIIGPDGYAAEATIDQLRVL